MKKRNTLLYFLFLLLFWGCKKNFLDLLNKTDIKISNITLSFEHNTLGLERKQNDLYSDNDYKVKLDYTKTGRDFSDDYVVKVSYLTKSEQSYRITTFSNQDLQSGANFKAAEAGFIFTSNHIGNQNIRITVYKVENSDNPNTKSLKEIYSQDFTLGVVEAPKGLINIIHNPRIGDLENVKSRNWRIDNVTRFVIQDEKNIPYKIKTELRFTEEGRFGYPHVSFYHGGNKIGINYSDLEFRAQNAYDLSVVVAESPYDAINTEEVSNSLKEELFGILAVNKVEVVFTFIRLSDNKEFVFKEPLEFFVSGSDYQLRNVSRFESVVGMQNVIAIVAPRGSSGTTTIENIELSGNATGCVYIDDKSQSIDTTSSSYQNYVNANYSGPEKRNNDPKLCKKGDVKVSFNPNLEIATQSVGGKIVSFLRVEGKTEGSLNLTVTFSNNARPEQKHTAFISILIFPEKITWELKPNYNYNDKIKGRIAFIEGESPHFTISAKRQFTVVETGRDKIQANLFSNQFLERGTGRGISVPLIFDFQGGKETKSEAQIDYRDFSITIRNGIGTYGFWIINSNNESYNNNRIIDKLDVPIQFNTSFFRR